ncbi:hypothetical protein DUZ99_09035 [Xylanibacillus composti]|uniref:Thioredoxin domain-containing protein n=1 Tax=Xylanibacillus composti TaxID=1572762 RepID=A0A8J4H1J3_9BACL|nr:hypothetical protein [Xylanibacillus composti]MDT9725128.1 hypothetical protein [Xylanibacillus composti]GIQ67299.1 hypothetical protein XYCOK13_01230 [Xylanibacillus composti]
MGKVDFVKLFGGKGEEYQVVETFEVKDRFPLPESISVREDGQFILTCFLSLSCPVCIELLPELPELFASYDMQFVLFIYGLEEEIGSLKEHFQFSFPVVRIADNELRETYKVPVTPYVYMLSADKTVIDHVGIDTRPELETLCNAYTGRK